MSPTPPRQEGWTCGCGTWNESFRTICRGCQTAEVIVTFEFLDADEIGGDKRHLYAVPGGP